MEKKMPREAKIEINGVRLTQAQSMTLRVAIECFQHELLIEKLGDDEMGQRMQKAYSERAVEITNLIHKEHWK